MDVYVMKDGKRLGPYQPFLLKEMLEDGVLSPLDPVWHEGMENWRPLGETESLRVVFRKPPEEEEADGDTGDPAPPALTPVKAEALALELTLAVLRQRRALGWRRFFARQLDTGFAVALVVLTAAAAGWTDFWALIAPSPDWWVLLLAPALVWIPVEAVMLTAFGWTPGRLILGLRVTDRDGHRPSFPAALKRSVLVWAGGMAFGLPFMVLPILPLAQWLYSFWHIQRSGSTLWDRSAGTRVTASELRRENAAGLAVFTAASASITAWIFFCVPMPERITGEDREVYETARQFVWVVGEPLAIHPPRKSGLPSRPEA